MFYVKQDDTEEENNVLQNIVCDEYSISYKQEYQGDLVVKEEHVSDIDIKNEQKDNENITVSDETIETKYSNKYDQCEYRYIQKVIDEDENSYMSINTLDTNNSLNQDLRSLDSSTSMSRLPRLSLLDGTFFKYLPEESTAQKITALCTKCSPTTIKVRGFDNSTSNFLSHLKRKHGQDCVNEYKAHVKKKKEDKKVEQICVKKFKNGLKMVKEVKTYTQEEFDQNIVEYFIDSMVPLKSIENPYFLKIFTNLEISNKCLKVMSHQSLGHRIDTYYEKQMSAIKSELLKVDFVCTTTDIWLGKTRNFLRITAHWITKDLKRVSEALACERFKGTYSYDRITDLIKKINTEFGLSTNKLVASVIENSSNFVKAFCTFGVQLTNISCSETDETVEIQSEDSSPEEINKELDISLDEEEIDGFSLLPAHTLTLCATVDANKILNTIDTPLSDIHAATLKKCNSLWNAAGHLKTAEIIQDILQHKLSRPSETRWNSLYDALQQILLVQEKNLHLHRTLNIKNAMKKEEFDYIKEYLTCTAPVAEALNIMQSETNTYYGIILPCLLALKRKLQKIEKKHNLVYCAPLIETYRISVETRFKQFFDLNTTEAEHAALAALSYPRFKNTWLTRLDFHDQNKMLELFITVISKEINEEPQQIVTKTKNKENSFFEFDSDSSSDDSNYLTPKVSTNTNGSLTKAKLIMLSFFAEESEELNLLSRYPEIKNVFIKYNTPLPASAAVEKHLSFTTMMNLPKSHKLSDQMFEKRVVLKCNLNYSKKLK